MLTTSFRRQVLAAACLAAAATALGGHNALAACAVLEETAIGPNLQVASFMARQKARQSIRRSAGQQAAMSADYNSVACVPAAMSGTSARCTVQASFCTTPVILAPPQAPVQPVQPVLPSTPVIGGTCYSYRSKATGNSSEQAQQLAAGALANSLAQVGAQLGGPGVSTEPPACYYLDNGTNQVHCEMTARLCR